MTVFLRALEAEDKAAALRQAICTSATTKGRLRFEVDPASFTSVPRSPFAYWVSERLRGLFTELPPFETEGRVARQGGVNGDDFRWLRLWTEVKLISERHRYVPIAKGGKFSTFYAALPLIALWDVVRGTFWAFTGLQHRPSLRPASFDFYFRPGLTWPLRTNGLSLRVIPAGCIFGHKGPSAFVKGDNSQDLLVLAAITNSCSFGLLVSLQLARTELAQSYEVGLIQKTPVPELPAVDQATLAILARRSWSLKHALDTCTENSHAFTLPALLQIEGMTLIDRATAWAERVRAAETELAAIQAEIDARCFDLYGINEADRRAITEGFGASRKDATEPDAADEADGDDDEDTAIAADAASLTTELMSWAVGVAFGRFDVRLATGTQALPAEPEPFEALPVCSPAMLTGDDGLPLSAPPVSYPLTFPADGVVVDDPGHLCNLTTTVRAVFDIVFGEDADARWHEALALLDPKEHNLRTWLTRSFFEYHIRRHSKSRRKAPILWQLATPSASYSVWLYAHRLTRDSFFQVLNDLIGPKLTHEERKLTRLVQSAGGNPTASQRKEIADQETFVEELRTFREEAARIAPLWNPDLNDGVIINFAPLWRLVPQHRAWQKECKDCWDKLVAGNYDWAHLAMHLWPERVVLKCTKDRSLAIAHSLEEVFWVEGSDGKWQPRKIDQATINNLIAERTSAAVKDALKSLLEAPSVSASRRSQVKKSATRGAGRRRQQATLADESEN